MTGVDAAEVRRIATLARIDLDDAEIERFVAEFETILGYFEQLDAVPEVPTDAETDTVLREDTVIAPLEQSEALANAPETEEGYFKGPPVS
ncbi:UNVERIFIED_CONTAM: glutamyl-tRNA amidotransferase [Euhalothece sp. KZN 001]